MKNSFIKYLFYGLLGGTGMFLLDLYDVYAKSPGWLYLIIFISIPLIPMMLRRLKKNSQRSFSALFKIGMIVSAICLIIYNTISLVYPKFFISPEKQTQLVDEKVNRMIMEFKGSKIDIFAMEEHALDFFDSSLKDSIPQSLVLFAFYIFFNTLFALILKTEKA